MVNNFSYTASGLSLTELSEGLKLVAYQDGGGVWTCGYGHTQGVTSGTTCTQQIAESWLSMDVANAVFCVNHLVIVELTQNEFNALVDFVFNLGSGNFSGSTLLRKLNSGDYAGAALEFPKWDLCAGSVSAGLLARRAAEQALFNLQS